MIELLSSARRSIEPLFGDTALFATAVGISVTLSLLLGLHVARISRSPVRRRLLQSSEGGERRLSGAGRIDRALAPVRTVIVPRSDRELSAIRTRLGYAGFRGDEIVTVYYASRLLSLVALAQYTGHAAFPFSSARSDRAPDSGESKERTPAAAERRITVARPALPSENVEPVTTRS